jgi:hypothetical protein
MRVEEKIASLEGQSDEHGNRKRVFRYESGLGRMDPKRACNRLFYHDGVMKLIQPQVVIDATRQIGWPADPATLTTLGLIFLACTALYAFPRTAVLGAILLTGYLGGAVASHARQGDPLFTHDLFGIYLGLFVWGGLWFRDARI